ncbi:MAG: glycosyltransferase family 4 protein [Gaiellaceae bacterium]
MLAPARPPAGFLRTLVVFHESEALGAGRSVLHALGPLRGYGWTASGWFPGEGPLLDEIGDAMSVRAYRSKPIRYSARGWRAHPGVLARLRESPAYLRAFRRALVRARPHVVHANTLRTLPEARVARSLGLPVVVHVHELPRPGAKTSLTLRAAAITADVLVAVSEAVAEVVRRHAGEKPVLVAYNGVPPYDGQRRPSSPAIVGSIGTICETKGTDVYLEAAALALESSSDLRFEHIGQSGLDEDVEFARRISALARSPESGDPVRLLGRRPANDGLDRWEMLVLPSRQDAFPLTSLEAMAAGVPVVAARVGGLVEQIDHLETGILVDERSPRAFADWIVRLHRDSDLRDRLARSAFARVRDRFTVERQGAVLHKAYLAALNLRHGPPPVRRRTLELV